MDLLFSTFHRVISFLPQFNKNLVECSLEGEDSVEERRAKEEKALNELKTSLKDQLNKASNRTVSVSSASGGFESNLDTLEEENLRKK